jgi:hypothetical protein
MTDIKEVDTGPDLDLEIMEQKPLTEWANEPTVADLKADLEEASTHHELHVADVNRWLDNLG